MIPDNLNDIKSEVSFRIDGKSGLISQVPAILLFAE